MIVLAFVLVDTKGPFIHSQRRLSSSFLLSSYLRIHSKLPSKPHPLFPGSFFLQIRNIRTPRLLASFMVWVTESIKQPCSLGKTHLGGQEKAIKFKDASCAMVAHQLVRWAEKWATLLTVLACLAFDVSARNTNRRCSCLGRRHFTTTRYLWSLGQFFISIRICHFELCHAFVKWKLEGYHRAVLMARFYSVAQ